MPIVAITDFTFPLLEIEEQTVQTVQAVQTVSECWWHSLQLLDVFPWSADLTTITPYLMARNTAQVTFKIEIIG